MTKLLITVVVVLALAVGAWNLYQYWGQYSEEKAQQQAAASTALDPRTLPGLPAKLEGPLAIAQKRGATGLRDWLKYYRKDIQDPRLAWIELDCCVLLAPTSPAEAKQLFASVKERLSSASPVYPRLKQLEKTFE